MMKKIIIKMAIKFDYCYSVPALIILLSQFCRR